MIDYPEPANDKDRAIAWLLSGDTGASSKTICAVMTGNKPECNMAPSDAGDFGRCYRLLKLIPEWRSRLDEMREYDRPCSVNGGSSQGGWNEDDKWSTFVDHFDEWSELFEKGELTHDIMSKAYRSQITPKPE